MKSPFPGMDPYLEARNLWRGLHTRLITQISNDLQPQIIPRYVAMVEERILLGPLDQEMWADVNVREREAEGAGGVALATRPSPSGVAVPEQIEAPESSLPHRFVAIRDVTRGRVVTVIELLSPWNKTGKGLQEYQEKQKEVLGSEANLVEIDLLRRGRHTVAVPRLRLQASDYRICTHRAESTRFEVVRFGLRNPLPNIAIPLRSEDQDVVLHLGAVFNRCYDEGAYAYIARYGEAPESPLPPEDAEWAQERIRHWREEQGTATSGQ